MPTAPQDAGYSGTVVAAVGVAGVLIGTTIGVVIMMVAGPGRSAAPAASASVSASATGAEQPTAAASARAAPSAKPGVDPAAAAAARRLAELRTKVKGVRHKPMDAQCDKYFDGTLLAGYVYSGGTFDENAYVAGASGCKALARAAKANWFCCFR
ncbi:MAG TPA: hypothetical protein ENK57_17360 [Polyangiaceae bacterium]|nr:hypothetical protein [Polyangiaceae bacterium]